jgi:hypothetical protein
MTEKGNADQQPGAGQGVEVAGNNNADTLEALIDRMDAVVEQPEVQPETGEPKTEDGQPTTDDGEPTEEPAAEEETTEEAPEEDEVPEEHKSVFSEEAHKIFKERLGKEKAKREKLTTELETVKAERDELKKSADPAMKEAVSAAGIAPEFLDGDSAKTIAEAEKLTRRINWARDASKNPDGFEDETSGKIYTPQELLAYAMELSTDSANMEILAEARNVRKAVLARQKEAIAEGLKVIAAREKAKKALTPGEKKPAKASPPVPTKSTTAPSNPAPTGDYREKFRKSGRTLEDLIDATM